MLQLSQILKAVLSGFNLKERQAENSSINNDYISKLKLTSNIRYGSAMKPVVVWNVNNQCNMTCPHCYSLAKVNTNSNELTTSQCKTIIDSLKDYGIPILIFSGGEPLLREDIFDLISYAAHKRITCHLSTNGTLITSEIAHRLKNSGISYTGVSIDGFPEFNDKYRGFQNGFTLALEGVMNAKNAGMDCGVRMTIGSENFTEVLPLIDKIIEHKIPRFYLSHLVYGGRGKSYSKNDLDKNQNRELMIKLFDKGVNLLEKGVDTSLVFGGNDADGIFLYHYIKNRYGKTIAHKILDFLKLRGGNSAGEKILNIDHKGNVHPDQFWQTSNCGNILDKSLVTILNSELIQLLKFRTSYLKGKCKRCAFLNVCRGSHRERALVQFNDLWAEDPSCYLTEKEIAETISG